MKPNSGKLLLSLLQDAHRFALRNRFIVDQAPLQIYVSALLFAPTSSETRRISGDSLRKYFVLMPHVPDGWGAERQKLEGHQLNVRNVAFSPDASVVMTASSEFDSPVRLWDAVTGEERQRLQIGSSLTAISMSPCWTIMATGSKNKVRIWDPVTGEQQHKLKGHTDIINDLSFSSNAKLLVSGSKDKTVRLWDSTTGREVAKLDGENLFEAQAFSPGGSMFVSWSDSTVTLWNTASGKMKLKLKHKHSIGKAIFSPNSKAIAFAFNNFDIIIWDIATRKEVQRLEGQTRSITAIAFSADGSMLASGSDHGIVRVWDVPSGEQRKTLTGHVESIDALAFSPDCRVIASGSEDRTARLWDLTEVQDRQRLDSRTGSVWAIALSPDRRMVALGFGDTSVRLWDAVTMTEQRKFEGEEWSWPPAALAFSQSGKTVVATGALDHTVRFWDTATGAQKHKLTLEGLDGATCAVGLSLNGEILVTGSDDKTIRAWDATTGQHKWMHRSSVAVSSFAFSSDGGQLETDTGQLDLATGSARLPAVATVPRSSLAMDSYSPWIRRHGADFLWLPHEYRGVCDVSGPLIVIGHTSGEVTTIELK